MGMSDKNKQIPNEIKLYNAISIANDNIAIKRIEDKCIDCGLCRSICEEREGIKNICDGKSCVYCGQCIQSCPVNALVPKSDVLRVKNATKNKVCIAYIAPAVRVAMGKELNITDGTNVMGKIVAAPTAGSCGILRGVLLAVAEEKNISDDDLVLALFNAAGIGAVIA